MYKRNEMGKEIPEAPQNWTNRGLSRKAWQQLYNIQDTPPTKVTVDESSGPKEKGSGVVVSEKKFTAEWEDPDAENKKIIHFLQ